ncbi:hypothetical protein RCL1_008445 [Eukaryota sp. TZLM3-RCL]
MVPAPLDFTDEHVHKLFTSVLKDPPVRLSFFQLLKYILISPALVIVRWVVTWLLIATYWLVMKIVLFRFRRGDRPLPKYRTKVLFVFFRFMVRLIMFVNGYYWIEEIGTKPENSAKYIIVPNHSNWQDIMFMLTLFPPSFIAKSSTKNIPFVGGIAKSLRSIFVNRDDPLARQKVAEQIKLRAQEAREGKESIPLLVFAEGTTTPGHGLLTFKRGAFAPLVPVQPIIFRYGYNNCPQSWSTIHLFKQIARVMAQVYNKISVEYLPQVVPKEGESPEKFADRVRSIMADSMGVPVLPHSSTDKNLYEKWLAGSITTHELMIKTRGRVWETEEDLINPSFNKCVVNTSYGTL